MISTSAMEVDSPSTNLATRELGSVTIALHPLVALNVSEHWTRFHAQEGRPQQVFGALLGRLKGRNIELCNSFELQVDEVGGSLVVDRDFFQIREAQFKQVFGNLDFVGWYTTGAQPNEVDVAIHKQICEILENPVLLKLNPAAPRMHELPIKVYESVIDIVHGEAKMLFVEVKVTLATEEAERIGIDHVARLSATENADLAALSEHFLAELSAIKMLHARIGLILNYLRSVQSSGLPLSHEILREVSSLCSQLPVMDSEVFRKDLLSQANDVAILSYLGVITNATSDVNQFINKFNILHNRQVLGRRAKGMLF